MSLHSTMTLFALVMGLVTCLISLSIWLGSPEKAGPRYWFWGFVTFLSAVILSVSGWYWSLGWISQFPILALETIGGALQYVGFRLVLNQRKKPRLGSWIVVAVIGVAASTLSIRMESAELTFLLENLITLSLPVLAFHSILRSPRLQKTLQRFLVLGLLGAMCCFFLLNVLGFLGLLLGLGWPLIAPFQWGIWGPSVWFWNLTLLVTIEGMVLNAVLLEENASSLVDLKEERRKLVTLNTELRQFQRDILGTMAELLERRTEETAAHVGRVADLSLRTLVALGWDEDRALFVAEASRLHDIGKVGIPDSVLKSSGVLNHQERAIMQRHAEAGAQLLRQSDHPFFQLAATIASEHHEHWDGKGYPAGKQGDAISVEARVVALADTFDALVTRRSYKEPWPLERVLTYIRDQAGHQFDPRIVGVFLKVVGSGESVPG